MHLQLMPEWPLLVTSIIDHAARVYGAQEVVTREFDKNVTRTNYADIAANARRVTDALVRAGVRPGDRVATLAWNTARHLEVWYGIAGAGAVVHTINPRLSGEQLSYIANKAEDRILFFSGDLAPIAADIAASCETITRSVQLDGAPATADVENYDDFIEGADAGREWVAVDERDPCGLCFTSGTTGRPKGVLYAHRSMIIHTLVLLSANAHAYREKDSILPIAPMFHGNAWGTVYTAPLAGAKYVLPGRHLDPESILDLLHTEKVSITCGVPTVINNLMAHLRTNGEKLPETLERLLLGGTAPTRRLIDEVEDQGVEFLHGWGMTEMSPAGTLSNPPPQLEPNTPDARAFKQKQGRPVYSVEMRLIDDNGAPVPHDGVSMGHVEVRGAAVMTGYFGDAPGDALNADGYLRTGDVAVVFPDESMLIADREKDLIKSGGEWIPSIELEEYVEQTAGVEQAAVVAAPDAKWDERPVAFIRLAAGATVSDADVHAAVSKRAPKWWLPEHIVRLSEFPLNATGKVDKAALRRQVLELVGA